MGNNFLAKTTLNDFDLLEEHLTFVDERTIIIKRWNWDYQFAHKFQRYCVEYLQEFPLQRILIACNHPRVFTHGRGLQKPRKGEVLELKDFDLTMANQLPFNLHQIERGGGLTFHHPGQYIFYPIVRLNPKTLSLSKMTDDIFDTSIEVLEEWGLKGLTHQHKLLGLWLGQRKIASMGIAIERLTTFHGMALNILKDAEMIKALQAVNPCGLGASVYLSVEEQIGLPEDSLEKFHTSFMAKIISKWSSSSQPSSTHQ